MSLLTTGLTDNAGDTLITSEQAKCICIYPSAHTISGKYESIT